MSCVVVLDIGKTNIKVHVLDKHMESVFEQAKPNIVMDADPYPHFDVDAIWDWFLSVLQDVAEQFTVRAISVTTHGATAALIDRLSGGNGLVLPILDYEFTGPDSVSHDYAEVRSPFAETSSPSLPAGMNLGRQLYWQQNRFPDQFGQATDILLYPQYWVWRLTGRCCSEVTSLGCHTDLWAPAKGGYSQMVDRMGWRSLFAEIKPAASMAGAVSAEVSQKTGLPESCLVTVGIHDSNASYLRYVKASKGEPFSVISTGTWAITMTNGGKDVVLDESRDMLMNVDFQRAPVACARFMAGREYETICHKMGSFPSQLFSLREIELILETDSYALPAFCQGSGPFSGKVGALHADAKLINGAALASLYCALMLDFELDLLKAEGDVFLEGAFLKNALLCQLLATLRGEQRLFLSSDSTGTVRGAAALADPEAPLAEDRARCEPLSLPGLLSYRERWRDRCQSL
ncbi:FGGY family carbohydrate kinase [Gilvimarinus sp. SDUM040013]|uniref:FGGY family carbohydrate kinase n=1 Tax=Gilvimarinus gilvus TaxID=3058038 RepID=A0ABU4RX36_9GAMM|nr:FGGY family carbohydrate kinase [Gilvimarinus sp. SDUM040013]MDO3386663.1 FGGY family carbohydrate kinase [Gilvimarinus sp. SDUM040013]MDX6849450.1 FGGY family carbohydrate kinase [Gilvimarinus sp. SDUM040013]